MTITPQACLIQDCSECVTYVTEIITKDNIISSANTFHLEVQKEERGGGEIYECMEWSLPCTCTNNTCMGSQDYCKKQKCGSPGSCMCHIKSARITMAHHDKSGKYSTDFDIISVKECFFNITQSHLEVHQLRRLLVTNSFNSQQGEDFTKFIDPVFTLNKLN